MTVAVGPSGWRALLRLGSGMRVLEVSAALDGVRAAELAATGATVIPWRAESSRVDIGPVDAIVIQAALGPATAAELSWPQVEQAVADLAGCLKPGGTLLVSFANPLLRLPLIEAIVARLIGRPVAPASRGRRWARPRLDQRQADLVGAGLESVVTFAALPAADRPKLLVPLTGPAALGYFLGHLVPGGGGWVRRVAVGLATVLHRLGWLAPLLPAYELIASRPLTEPGPTAAVVDVVATVARILGRASHRLSPLLIQGWRMDSTSVTALVFEDGGQWPAAVVKIGHGPGRARIELEQRNLEALARSMRPEFRAAVPQVRAAGDDGAARFLVQTMLSGQPLSGASDAGLLGPLAERLADWMVGFHEAIGPVAPPHSESRIEHAITGPVARYRRSLAPSPGLDGLLARAEAALVSAAPSLALYYMHDDMSPSNVLVDGDRIGVIDWEEELKLTPPAFDLFHLFACLAVGDGDHDGVVCFQRVFLEPTALAWAAHRGLLRYVRALGIDPALVRPLFVLYWVTYALEKLDNPQHGDGDAHGPWGLVQFESGRCANLELVAAQEAELQLP